MKLKHLLAVALVAIGGSAWAQTYTEGVEVAAGTDYFLMNVESGKFLTDGMDWGTHATVDNAGRVITFELKEGNYAIKTKNYTSDDKVGYMTDNGYLDTPGAQYWQFVPTTVDGYTNAYIIKQADDKVLHFDAATCRVNVGSASGNAATWIIVPIADRQAQKDYSYLLQNTDFNRPWERQIWSGNYGAGGLETNRCQERFNTTFDVNQTINATVPNGKWRLSCQAFYRAGGGGTTSMDQNAVIYINSTTAPVMNINTEAQSTQNGGFSYAAGGKFVPNSMNDASNVFTAGYYQNSVTAVVTDGKITVGIKKSIGVANDWTIYDNFRLEYLGEDLADYETPLVEAQAAAKAINPETTPLNADVYAALQTTIGTYGDVTFESFSTVADIATAIDALKTATDAANASIANYAAVAALVNVLDAAGQAAFAASESGQKIADKSYVNEDVTADLKAAVKVQTSNNADFTSLIDNPSFETGDMTGWEAPSNGGAWVLMTRDGGDDPKVGNYWYEKYGWAGKIDVHQTITGVPAGTYVVGVRTLDQAGILKLVAKCGETTAETLITKATAGDFTVEIVVPEDNSDLTIGLYCENHTTNKWVGFDNFTLRHSPLAFEDLTPAVGKMNAEVAAAQTTAIEAYNAGRNAETLAAAKAAIAAAEASIADYATKKVALDAQADLMSKTNVYDADAYAAAGWTDLAAGYENGTLTNTDAVVNPTTITGWHASTDYNFLLKAWTIGGEACDNFDKALYINTWSVEGETDGSNFKVPFFEYWTGDANSLGANKISATVDVENGYYKVTAFTRIRIKNGSGDTAEGIVFSANGEIGSNACVGTPADVFRYDTYTAIAKVTDGKLVIAFDVKDGNNVSWLSFRDVKYTAIEADEYNAILSDKGGAAATIAVGSAGYATFVAPFEVAVPAGVKAYTVDGADKAGLLTLTEVEGTIAANTPVVLEGALAATNVSGVEVAGTPEAGMLTGVYTDTPAPAGAYVLQNQDAVVGFYKVGSIVPTVKANRAYLNASAGSEVKVFTFGNATGINAIEALTSGAKIYDLNGRQLQKLQKGVNIVNGVKVLVK